MIFTAEQTAGIMCFTAINGSPAILTNIYVHVTGGTLMFPEIKYVLTSGRRVEDGVAMQEKVIP